MAAVRCDAACVAVFGLFAVLLLYYSACYGGWVCRAVASGVHPVTAAVVASSGVCSSGSSGTFVNGTAWPSFSGRVPSVPRSIILTYSSSTASSDRRVFLWRELNPGFSVDFYDDERCLSFLLRVYGPYVAHIFSWIPDGPIKSDFFRVHYLFSRGGVYCDLDAVPVSSLSTFFHFGTSSSRPVLVTSSSRHGGQLNPMFLMSSRGHPTLGAAVSVYRSLFVSGVGYSYWSWSVVHVLSSLHHCGFPVNVSLQEECGGYFSGDDLYGCFLSGLDVGGERGVAVRVRGGDYDRHAHGFVSS